MNIDFHSTVIFCDDLQKQREFYEVFLGLEIVQDFGNCIVFGKGFTLWKLDEHYPVSKELGYTYEPIGNRNLEVCFETENLEEAIEKVLMSELRVLHNLTEEKWGQYTIRFYDPEGNLVEIGESLKCMVKRMKSEGLNEAEIVKKSGLDEPLVQSLISS